MTPTKLPKEHKLQLIAGVQHYFESEFSMEMGRLAAENVLDFMLKELAPYVYNQAVADARKVMEQQMASIEDELYALEQPLPLDNRK